MHQVVVAVEGWEAVAPVSLDKVGTYFREAVPKVDPLDPVVSWHRHLLSNNILFSL